MNTVRRKPKLLLNTVSVSLGCSCRKSKLYSIFSPKSKSKLPKHHPHHPHPHPHRHHSSSSFSIQTNSTFIPFVDYPSPSNIDAPHRDVFGRRVGSKAVAIEKDSDDPYTDFRQSMLQMIVENEIYSTDDLKQLLNCFLQLNSPCLHGIIIRAFTEIWNSVFFSSSSSSSAAVWCINRSNISPKVYGRPKSYEI
ncbi:hypothetical protein Nepgr_030554 [Nepenthes gracilis]|uniref:Transcription repressor n=1 Tax=Nepenthes gracilis TaxID=150966 RepID=A0AAD3Y6N9_NEPGR|nr:hypothetical protein Nepgr_030554 [Nepenthes gracilis]